MRKTLLALAAAATLAVSAASPAYAGPRTYPGPGGYPYWSGYVDAPVGQPIPPATGVPSASGTVIPGACAACASAADSGKFWTQRSKGAKKQATNKAVNEGREPAA
jgi:hypothetical protein